MTTEPRFERTLPDLLEALYLAPTPDYRDEVLAVTGRTRQRPAWTFPGRWFPMVDIARRPVQVQRVRWGPVAAVLLVALLLATVAAVVVGSRPHLPPPFGLAGNGVVAYADASGIVTADPVTGQSRVIVPAAAGTSYGDPVFSRDGTHLLYGTWQGSDDTKDTLWVVAVDGSGLTQLTPTALSNVTWWEFAPDGGSVAIISAVNAFPRVSTVNIDGSGFRTFDPGPAVETLAFRPPDGRQLLLTGSNNAGLYLMDADGTNRRTLVDPKAGGIWSNAVWSPDGTKVAYGLIVPTEQTIRLHVMTVDDGHDELLHPNAVGSEMWPVWSPDGTRLVIQHAGNGTTAGYAIVQADGTGTPIEIKAPLDADGANYEWSPDGTEIIARPNDDPKQQLIWDAATGASRTAPWAATSYPTWQRVAR